MTNVRRLLTLALVSATLMAAIPTTSASAATSATSQEFKSMSNGLCLDVLNDQPFIGAHIVTTTCKASDTAEHFMLDLDGKNLHIYFTPKLCIANVGGAVVLEGCTQSVANVNETAMGHSVVAEDITSDTLTAQKQTSASKTASVLFVPKGKTFLASQKWQFSFVNNQ